MAAATSPLRPFARLARETWGRLRFLAWARHLDFELRRRNSRLRLEAPFGAVLESFPVVRVEQLAEGGGTLTLRLGRDVTFGRGVTMVIRADASSVVEIGQRTRLDDGVHLHLRGGTLHIGEAAVIREFVILRCEGELIIGDKANVSHGCVIHCKQSVELGDLVGLAEHVTVVDSDHAATGTDEYFLDRPVRVSPVRLGRNSFVAAKSVVLRGAQVGPNAVVAAGSVVPAGDYPGAWLIGGTPARPIKALGDPAAPDTA